MHCARCGESILGSLADSHQCTRSMKKQEHTVVHLVRPGEILDGRWRVEHRVGQGAMGSVFAGQDLKRRRPVAIKFLSPEHCRKPKVLARFEREARLMTKLRHPNIVQLHGLGRHGALPYIVMQFLEGTTLAELLKGRGGKLPPVETLAVVRQVCSGLSFIHHHRLVHRDIKPQNVFIGPDGHVTILDLGVVRDRSSPGLTKPGAMVGTPYYMAPEQILGTTEVDRRADVYGLGAVIFELLTGTPPFVAPSNFEVLYAHRRLPPPDASVLSAFVPKAVADVISRALAKSPDDRPQSVHELLADLEASYCLDSERTSPGVAFSFVEEEGKKSRARRRRQKSPATPPPPPAESIELIDSAEVELIESGDPDEEATVAVPAASGDTRETMMGSDPGATVTEHGELRVVTTVRGLTSGAKLFLDDEAKGSTPASLQVAAGIHRLRVERAGFEVEEREVTVPANEVVLVRVALAAKGKR